MEQKTVLYIEDNFHNRRIVRKILESRGYTVIEAEDGPSGLDMIQELQPPLVLLDIGLPGMDGLEVVRQIRRDALLQECSFTHIGSAPASIRSCSQRAKIPRGNKVNRRESHFNIVSKSA